MFIVLVSVDLCLCLWMCEEEKEPFLLGLSRQLMATIYNIVCVMRVALSLPF